MNRLLVYVVCVVLGAGGFWCIQRFVLPVTETRDESGAANLSDEPFVADGSLPAESPEPALLTELGTGGDRLDSGALEIGKPEPATAIEAQAEPAASSGVFVLGGSEERSDEAERFKRPENPLLGADRSQFKEQYELAEKAFADNDARRGLEIYRWIFEAAKDRSDDIRVATVARKLAEHTENENDRLEYYLYLSRFDSSAALIWKSSLRAAKVLLVRPRPDRLKQAWELLTRAYVSATNDAERRQVLDALEPLLNKYVFSGRDSSPLLEKHTVASGDSLSEVAKKYRTTMDSIKRLNTVKGETIRIGQRLRILPGEVEVRVKKTEFRLWVLIDGKLLMQKQVGLGQDNSTPEGRFKIVERQKNPIWYRPGERPLLPDDPRNILGTRWLGFQDSEYGIHGTRDEMSIGKEVSSGCIRLKNADIDALYDFVPWGTWVTIED